METADVLQEDIHCGQKNQVTQIICRYQIWPLASQTRLNWKVWRYFCEWLHRAIHGIFLKGQILLQTLDPLLLPVPPLTHACCIPSDSFCIPRVQAADVAHMRYRLWLNRWERTAQRAVASFSAYSTLLGSTCNSAERLFLGGRPRVTTVSNLNGHWGKWPGQRKTWEAESCQTRL